MSRRYHPHKNPHKISVDALFLQERFERAYANGYDAKAKWIEFCEQLLAKGYTLELYEAQETRSKYIYITHPAHPSTRAYKVRFSNHPPNLWKQLHGDCDFFVGVSHGLITNTAMAMVAVKKYFQTKESKPNE